MQVSRDFTIAVHTLLATAYFSRTQKVTSDFIAGSVGVNPVIIRRMFQKLTAAGLLSVKGGRGGTELAKSPEEITLLDVYKAAGCEEHEIFNFHENPSQKCPVGGSIHKVLDGKIADATKALEQELSKTTLGELLAGI